MPRSPQSKAHQPGSQQPGAHQTRTLQLSWSARSLFRFWTLAALAVVTSGIIAELVRFWIAPGRFIDTIRIVSLDLEGTIPVWFSAMTLAACGLLLLGIGRWSRDHNLPHQRAWQLLGLFCLWISVDEVASLHNHAGKMLRIFVPAVKQAWPAFYFSWTLIALAFVGLATLLLWRFFGQLSQPFRSRLLIAICVFFIGGLGLEMVGGWLLASSAPRWQYAICTSLEETLEIVGVGLLFRALLGYWTTHIRSATVSLVVEE